MKRVDKQGNKGFNRKSTQPIRQARTVCDICSGNGYKFQYYHKGTIKRLVCGRCNGSGYEDKKFKPLSWITNKLGL
jgi:DnaJ-class molecular chaperone